MASSLFVKRLGASEVVHIRTSGYRESDVASLCKAANNKNIARWLRGVFPHPYTEADARFWVNLNQPKSKDLIAGPDCTVLGAFNVPIVLRVESDGTTRCHEAHADAGPQSHSVAAAGEKGPPGVSEDLENEAVIGTIGLTSTRRSSCNGTGTADEMPHDTVELGYWLAEGYWGRGIMKQCVQVFTEHLFDTLSALDTIEALAVEANAGSCRTLLAAGFEKDAIRKPTSEPSHPVCSALGLPSTVELQRYALTRSARLKRRRTAA
eukprot:TRINITY_DN13124_c0_g1_i1.p1 TRINITY_DN13124_c0_g1~~TRINITY_DN13124_c0_g1_i1.p1  ORF type:complete len:265 (+),score=29.13 TRINITY_DN13124_c0_g1_i1:79-873(+)